MIPIAYRVGVGVWKIAPSEFWKMHPWEFWQIAEVNRVAPDYGSMSEDEVSKIYDETYGVD